MPRLLSGFEHLTSWTSWKPEGCHVAGLKAPRAMGQLCVYAINRRTRE